MQTIIDFFTEIGKIIDSVIQWLIDFFAGLLEFTTSLPEYIDLVYSYIDAMPDLVSTIAVTTISFTLIFLVIGRRGT